MRALILVVLGMASFIVYRVATVQRKLPTVTDATTATSPTVAITVAQQTEEATQVGPPLKRVETPAVEIAPRPAAEGLTVDQAAARIAGTTGRPSIVFLYGTQCPLTRRMIDGFAQLAARHPGVDILAFGTDEELASEIPSFLHEHGANFPPIYLRDWEPGSLMRAMAPLGIDVKATWVRPLVAIRDANGRVVAQDEGVTDVAGIEQALERVTNR